MNATAERIERDFATLSREEQEQVVESLYRQYLAREQDDWPMSRQEELALRAAVREAEAEFRAGKGIPNDEMKRRLAAWVNGLSQ